MNQPFIHVEQGSDEWKQARLGHVTASNIGDVMAKGKDGAESIGRYKYKVRLLAERMTGVPPESYTNASMEWGVQNESIACMMYEAKRDVLLDKTGFWLHPDIKWMGVSPDRLVESNGLVEVKCPNTTTHLDYVFAGKVPNEYVKQVQAQLWVTGREWCDFVSFDPRLPAKNQLFIVRTTRDEKLIREMEVEVVRFLAEVEDLIIKLEQ